MVDPTTLLGGEVSNHKVFLISSSDYSSLGGMSAFPSVHPPSSRNFACKDLWNVACGMRTKFLS